MLHLLPRPVSSHRPHPTIDLHRSRKRAATGKPRGLPLVSNLTVPPMFKGYKKWEMKDLQTSIIPSYYSLSLQEDKNQPERVKFRIHFSGYGYWIIVRVLVLNISSTAAPSTHLASEDVRSTRRKRNLSRILSTKIYHLEANPRTPATAGCLPCFPLHHQSTQSKERSCCRYSRRRKVPRGVRP